MSTKSALAIVFAGLAAAIFTASLYIEQVQRESTLLIERSIAEQEKTLSALADLTAQNRADSVTESIIRDCSPESRQSFEQLLNRLATLDTVELTELQQLFEACARFFAERDAMMVARLEREYEVYEDYVNLYTELAPADAAALPTDDWLSYVTLKRERNQLLNEQVDIQASIITTLQTTQEPVEALNNYSARAQAITARVASLNRELTLLRDTLRGL